MPPTTPYWRSARLGVTQGMLVSFSGIVGSGKTSSARHAEEALKREGLPVVYLRFQHLGCFDLLRPSFYARAVGLGGKAPRTATEEGDPRRWSGYRRRPLTWTLALAYALRIVAFRMYCGLLHPRRCIVLDRYFYDNFCHLRLDTPAERRYMGWLCRILPQPDLAVLLTVAPETVVERRPHYAPEYISALEDAYARLARHFPTIVPVPTDGEDGTSARVDHLLRDLARQAG